MAKLADAYASGAYGATHESSSLSAPTRVIRFVLKFKILILNFIRGVWPNWLGRTLRVREVLGSSPSTPTKKSGTAGG